MFRDKIFRLILEAQKLRATEVEQTIIISLRIQQTRNSKYSKLNSHIEKNHTSIYCSLWSNYSNCCFSVIFLCMNKKHEVSFSYGNI